MYHHDEPKRGSLQHGSLPDPEMALKPIQPLLLLQRPKFDSSQSSSSSSSSSSSQSLKFQRKKDEMLETFDVRIKSKAMSNVTRACNTIKLNNAGIKRGHIIAHTPIFEPLMARNYILHMTVYECKKEKLSTNNNINNDEDEDEESSCLNQQKYQCISIIASWSRGSQGFVYPEDVGYPIESETFFIETLYLPLMRPNLSENDVKIIDNSGVRFTLTNKARKYDAGILLIGIQPIWTHIIPPGFRKVTSIGYCTGKCNHDAFSKDGIHVVGVQMQAHEMAQSIKVGLVRNGVELSPIAQDHQIDSEYLEYRLLNQPTQVLPGDDLLVECAYNSYDKTKLTLGGHEVQQEICQAFLVYYPKQNHLTSCQSKPKTKNFLKSLNIDKLSLVPPFNIELPEKYAGRTLEEHLKIYNWKAEFDHFERITKTSPIDIVCIGNEKKVR
jgi:hypothetical protein